MVAGIEIWALWVIVGIVLFVAEIFTFAFFLASLGIGCLMTGLATLWFHLGFEAQLTILCATTLVTAFTVRPLLLRYCFRPTRGVKTNVEALPGRTGRVLQRIDAASAQGRVLIGGEDWRATSADHTVIEENSTIVVVSVNGSKLVVTREEKE